MTISTIPMHIPDTTHMHPLQKITQRMQVKRVEGNTVIYQESEHISHFYLVKSGVVKLRKSTAHGELLTMSILSKHDFFGEWSQNLAGIHFTSAESTTTCDIGMISISDLQTLLQGDSLLMLAFLDFVHTNSMIIQTKLRDLLLFGKNGALSSLLIRLSHTFGTELNSNQALIERKFSHQEMAEMMGTSRESVTRMLNEWKQLGAIDWTENQFIIKDLSFLRERSQCENCPKSICRM